MVTPLVQTTSSSRPTPSDQSRTTAYERFLAAGLGAAVAAVAALALLAPTAPAAPGAPAVASQAVAHGKATPRTVTAPVPPAAEVATAE